ncbi:hypothetical protein [Roseomonas sp. 18066]|uniref:hypothetical protein n=1 Tax=Roseomonas sp. 18066 TaxID=2681412 RepID=UPI001358207D|nr:hypothetical protein [Roseomonas sp. 18066]
MHDFSSLPPELRKQLRAHLIEFLDEINVEHIIDVESGEVMVPLHELARAMGKTEEEIKAELAALAAGRPPFAPLS